MIGSILREESAGKKGSDLLRTYCFFWLHGIPFLHSFSERTMGITTLWTVLAQSAVANKCQLFFAYFLTGQNAGQHQIQHCDTVIQAAGRDPQQRYASDIGR